nr:hypothetical protein [Burkholderia sola]
MRAAVEQPAGDALAGAVNHGPTIAARGAMRVVVDAVAAGGDAAVKRDRGRLDAARGKVARAWRPIAVLLE